jgi:ParB family chromosome partitioning protein
MRTVGMLGPITVQYELNAEGHVTDKLLFRAGLHRLEAAKRLGWPSIPSRFLECDAQIEGRLVEVTENLHRAELTVQERSEHIARWLELLDEKRKADAEEGQPLEEGGQLGHPSGGAQPHDKGIAKVAGELGTSRQQVRRAVKIARIIPEAKEAAKAAGLDNNQSKLLKVAAAPAARQLDAVKQVAAPNADRRTKEFEELKKGYLALGDEDRRKFDVWLPQQKRRNGDGLDIPPMLLRDPDAKAKAVAALIDQAIMAIGALAVIELVAGRLADHERLVLAERLSRARPATSQDAPSDSVNDGGATP